MIDVMRDSNVYAFTLPAESRTIKYRVNGQFARGNEEISTEGPPHIEKVVFGRVRVQAHSSMADQPDLTLAEYDTRVAELRAPLSGTSVWPDLDSEFAYRRFVDTYEVISREEIVAVEEIPYRVFGKPDAEPYITPLRHLGDDFCSPLAIYYRESAVADYARERAAALGFVESEAFLSPTRPNSYKLRQHKNEVALYMGGLLVYEHKSQTALGRYRDTMAACQERKRLDRQEVDGAIGTFLAARSRGIDAFEMAGKIKGWAARINALDVKIRALDDKGRLVRALSEFAAQLLAGGKE